MGQESLPNAQLELVHKVNYENEKEIEPVLCETSGKGILNVSQPFSILRSHGLVRKVDAGGTNLRGY